MIDIFKVTLSEDRVLTYNWYCDRCSEVTVTETIDTIKPCGAEVFWPKHTPTSKRCPDCGNWASFISANLSRFWIDVGTGEIIRKIVDYPGACYNDRNGVVDPVTKEKSFGEDGLCLVLVLPNNTLWYLDSRSSGCTKRDDTNHRCWNRTGSVENGDLTLSRIADNGCGVSDLIQVNGIQYSLVNNRLEEIFCDK